MFENAFSKLNNRRKVDAMTQFFSQLIVNNLEIGMEVQAKLKLRKRQLNMFLNLFSM